ncbi:MAG: hypothetical protein V4685_12600 [Bacteroidota bacterium]
MEPVLLPVDEIKLMNKQEIDAAHAIAFKALHEGMYSDAPPEQLEILKSNFNNLDSILKSGYLQH